MRTILTATAFTALAIRVAGATGDRRYLPPTLSLLMSIVHIAKLVAFGALGLTVGTIRLLAGALCLEVCPPRLPGAGDEAREQCQDQGTGRQHHPRAAAQESPQDV